MLRRGLICIQSCRLEAGLSMVVLVGVTLIQLLASIRYCRSLRQSYRFHHRIIPAIKSTHGFRMGFEDGYVNQQGRVRISPYHNIQQ